MSALRGLKRSWSGSARDLGNDDDFEEDDFTITSSNSNSKGSKPPGSSPDTAIELDETTNSPDKSAAKRRAVEADAKEVKLQPHSPDKSAAKRRAVEADAKEVKLQPQVKRQKSSATGVVFKPPRQLTAAEEAELGSDEERMGLSTSMNAHLGTSNIGPSTALNTSMPHRSVPGMFQKTHQQLRDEFKQRSNGVVFRPGDQREEITQYGIRKSKLSSVFLSNEQKRVHKMVVEDGKNVFFTGSAGTGKSVLLREIIKALRIKHDKTPDVVAVTASTGIAACNIGGVTLHSFAGIGLGDRSAPELVTKIKSNRKSAGRWLRTKVLIVDEISMIDPTLFDKLEEIARIMRKTPKHFGGIQIVVTGDFFQLPPVQKGGAPSFAFDAKSWKDVIHHSVNLTQVFRQKDETFVTMLNEMRYGKMSPETIARFKTLERRPQQVKGIALTELFPLRAEVDKSNVGRLDALKSTTKAYEARDGGVLPKEQRDKILSSFMAPQTVLLKVNAQVMLIKNTDDTLVNGSIGKVTGFMDTEEFKFRIARGEDLNLTSNDGHVILQPLPDPNAQVKMEASMSSKMAPAPPPRSRSTSPSKPAVPLPKYPLVNFVVPGGVRAELVLPEVWKNELPNGEIQAQREQVPLILAWAMSIHKSQGQTLPYCKIDLRKVFEMGQAYVALSRATSLETLQVIGFEASKVRASPRVIEFYKSLQVVKD